MKKNYLLFGRGFTLIELLVVIAIIGILASVVISSLTASKIKAEDRKLVTEVNSLRQALELYYTKYGYYPSTGGSYFCTAGTGSNGCTPGTSVLQVLVNEGFISKIPTGKGADGNGVEDNEIYYGSPGWWNSAWGYQIQFQVKNRNDTLGECNGACPSVYWADTYSYSIHP
jgi:type II secretion system protein G